MSVHPATTQISQGIRPVWSVFAVRMKKAWVLSYPLSAQRRLWSDWTVRNCSLLLLVAFCKMHWEHDIPSYPERMWFQHYYTTKDFDARIIIRPISETMISYKEGRIWTELEQPCSFRFMSSCSYTYDSSYSLQTRLRLLSGNIHIGKRDRQKAPVHLKQLHLWLYW